MYLFAGVVIWCPHTPSHAHAINGPLPWWSAQSSYIWWTGLQPCNRHKQGLIVVTVFQQKRRLCWSPWFGVLRSNEGWEAVGRGGGGHSCLQFTRLWQKQMPLMATLHQLNSKSHMRRAVLLLSSFAYFYPIFIFLYVIQWLPKSHF